MKKRDPPVSSTRSRASICGSGSQPDVEAAVLKQMRHDSSGLRANAPGPPLQRAPRSNAGFSRGRADQWVVPSAPQARRWRVATPVVNSGSASARRTTQARAMPWSGAMPCGGGRGGGGGGRGG